VYPARPRGTKKAVISGDETKRAENEATFREANEQIRAAERALEPPLDRVPYLCECDDLECRELVALTADEYAHVREDGATFAITPGHATEGSVTEEHEGYVVVRKSDRGGAVARALDPRKEGV
jgi:hypothetical protein